MSISRLFFLLLVIAGTSCGGGSKSESRNATTAVQYPTDLRVAKNVAKANRGQTSASLSYADAFLVAWKDGFWVQNPGEAKLTNDVLFLMDIALKEHPEDAAKIGTKRGEIYLATGDDARGRAVLIDVLAANPHPPAANMLLFSYPRSAKTEIDVICRAVDQTFDWGDGKYEFLQTCINWNGASNPQEGLVWAPPFVAQWFLSRRGKQAIIQAKIEADNKAKTAEPGWHTELKRSLSLPTD